MNKFKRLLKGSEVKKYFYNTSWMLGEKLSTMGLAMVVSIFVARYLGSENYGILSYALSISSLFAIATHMGLSGLAVRELVNNPNRQAELMGTIFGIKAFGAVIALIAYVSFIFITNTFGEEEFWVLLMVSITILLKPFLILEFWFESQVKAKYPSLVWGSSNILGSLIKIILVATGASLIYFASISVITGIFVIVALIYFFRKESAHNLLEWRFNFSLAKKLLGQGWMIMLGAVFAMVYLKIDQVMLRWFGAVQDVGIYAVASKISEAWYFIPSIIVASLFPKLLELRKRSEEEFNKRLQHLFDMLFCIALFFAILVSIVAKPLMNFLYGDEFSGSAIVLSIHIWAGIFISMRAAFSKWILVEDAVAFSMFTQGAGAMTNIVLNLVFIPLYGGIGAALATLISYAAASYFSLFFYKKTRVVFWIMSKSLIYPFRLSAKLFQS